MNDWMGVEQLKKRIKDTPKKLYEIYDRNWNRIQGHERSKRAASILGWATCSVRPLTVAEMAEVALIAEQDGDFSMNYFPTEITQQYIEAEISKLCSSLLKIRLPDENDPARCKPSQWTFHISHFTVRGYLMRRFPLQRLASISNCKRNTKGCSTSYSLNSVPTTLAQYASRRPQRTKSRRSFEITQQAHGTFISINACWKIRSRPMSSSPWPS